MPDLAGRDAPGRKPRPDPKERLGRLGRLGLLMEALLPRALIGINFLGRAIKVQGWLGR